MMKRLIRGVCFAALCALGAAAVPSCADTTVGGGTDSNTHWLSSCTSDADCGSLTCQCGVCTKACTDASGCAGLSGNVACQTASCASVTTKTCTATCTTAADCPHGGAGFGCESGICVAGQSSASGGGPGGSAPDASVQCPASFVEGAACDLPATTTCSTGCTNGYRGQFVCSGGHWVAGKGLFPCGTTLDGGSGGTPQKDGSAPHDDGGPTVGNEDAGNGISTFCLDSTQCRVVAKACCPSCTAPTVESSTVVDDTSVGAWYKEQCGNDAGGPCVTCEQQPGTLAALCPPLLTPDGPMFGTCELVDLKPYATCTKDADCVVQTTTCCGACSDDPNAFVAVSDPQAFLNGTNVTRACTEDCIACFDDAGVQRRGPSWLHARCDSTLGACVLKQDPH